MEGIVKMLYMEIPVFLVRGRLRHRGGGEAPVKSEVTEFNNEQRHCNQNAASFPLSK